MVWESSAVIQKNENKEEKRKKKKKKERKKKEEEEEDEPISYPNSILYPGLGLPPREWTRDSAR